VQAHSKRWDPASRGSGNHFFAPFTAKGAVLGQEGLTRALAPVRGVLLGTLLGGAFWGLLATLTWLLLAN
jgi:hypothetical protein